MDALSLDLLPTAAARGFGHTPPFIMLGRAGAVIAASGLAVIFPGPWRPARGAP
ncbi:MAG: hypothetical protein HY744_08220 [Deltaproteobacteria bacterium]|nr:hypothetical protein [Deltaproteobacteria bacterium]